MRPGKRNLITDVAGLRVGNSQDAVLKSGVTTLVADVENVASVHVMGGAPGTRETDLLQPENTVQTVDALVLSGGSAFGLDAPGGVQAALREQGKGFLLGDQRIPIVPGAILFDLINGGTKDWGRFSPYRELGFSSVDAATQDFDIGSFGAGTGALVGGINKGMKGGLGSASTIMPNGITIGALVAVNAMGSPTVGESANFWAAPFEFKNEFGGLGQADVASSESSAIRIKFRDSLASQQNTTIGIIATDAQLSKSEAKRFAIAAHDGLARAVWPAHTPIDGDLVFSIATGSAGPLDGLDDSIIFSAIAASTMSRAIARGIYNATETDNDLFPTWAKTFNQR